MRRKLQLFAKGILAFGLVALLVLLVWLGSDRDDTSSSRGEFGSEASLLSKKNSEFGVGSQLATPSALEAQEWPQEVGHEEDLNIPASATDLLEQRVRASPYDLVVERMAADESTEHVATDLAYYRSMVFRSEDDADWSRPIEKELLKYVLELPDSDTTQVSSIACRRWGCEMQFSHEPRSTASRSIWLGLYKRIPTLSQVMSQTAIVDGKVVQVVYVRRDDSNPTKSP